MAPHQGDVLQTRLGEGELQKKLTRLYREAKTLEEEQGINILFLAMGFLQWYEDEASKILREGPLVLVPVSLARDSRHSTYTLRAREEDITTNLPLAERLRDHGIVLPEIPEGEDWSPSGYFDMVAEAVSSRVRWSIDRKGVELGFFSFAKLLMYRDLAREAWPNGSNLSHPLLRGLLQDGFPYEEPLFPDDTKIDERFQPADLVHVLDADGSQTLAIETVRAGRNLVIHGPPGTGKSQTIANIIAAAAHDGKSVLFIAEKMVALKVVHDRLKTAGLGALCLELHSRMANKRALADELKQTLGSGAAEPGLADTTVRLTEARDALNRIARDLHAPIEATGMSAFQAIADLVRAKGLGLSPSSMSVPGMAAWTISDYEKVLDSAEAYAKIIQTSGPAHTHPWRGVRNEALEPTDLDRVADAGPQAASKLRDLAKLGDSTARLLPSGGPTSLGSSARLKRFVELLAAAPKRCSNALAQLHTFSPSQLATAGEMIGEAAQLVTGITAEIGAFRPAALEAEAANVRAQLVAGTSWFKRWKRAYRDASAELASWLTGSLPKSAAERVSLVDHLIALKAKRYRLEHLSKEAQMLFGPVWHREATDLSGLRAVIAWLRRVREEGFGFDLTPAFALLEKPVLQTYRARLGEEETAACGELEKIISLLDVDATAAFGHSSIRDVGIEDLAARLEGWASQVGRYSEWSKLGRANRTLRNYGLLVLADRIGDGALTPGRAVEEVRHARSELLWQLARERNPRLGQLRDLDRMKLVETFCQLETDRRQLAAGHIRAHHSAQMPRGAVGHMAIIRGEIARKRGHIPIRKLIERVGPTIQKIKPVFLMSPISVAQFIAPGGMEFDLLIIDEASQVRPEDALGVIARAKQMLVVGDAKQLPPTNFFNQLLSDDDVDEDDDDAGTEKDTIAGSAKVAELESVLTLCEARGVGMKMLRWHYRSKHPSLIEVSNDAFYGGGLFLPPSPVTSRDGEGFLLVRVQGAYDRGGKRTNEIEAKAIIEALTDHAKRNLNKSIGIVTFAIAQRDLILNLVEDARRREPALESFLNDQVDETFVKNLENVQGDERDHILVSVGYGPRAVGGRLDSMNFGPVSTDGGQRRLNVLFTRARYRCEVFCSFDPADIDTVRTTNEGVKVLKRYLTFAENGLLDEPGPTGEDYGSPFEEEAREIKSLGFLADPQVGTAGFKIDLGVRDAERPGCYILAVECDGAAYHGALWARERDRLRQEILESQGWRFHRIWSTDWFHRRSEEIKRLRAVLEAARTKAG